MAYKLPEKIVELQSGRKIKVSPIPAKVVRELLKKVGNSKEEVSIPAVVDQFLDMTATFVKKEDGQLEMLDGPDVTLNDFAKVAKLVEEQNDGFFEWWQDLMKRLAPKVETETTTV